ncbi:pyridoxal-dependent decarboxylase domain-containing protein 1 [Contarinia nasturtii]|uniref:pyridoxal-dependent decarboxylase domain-containing protein 1 n=1 Tax=Contarinia nasturtii TaxID=265458 RepID=UPI0012D46EC4|nr:pyridoxal-dependent decarboxylase domain-containing protein 1 [Contarinia nasturtii]
MEGGGNDVSSTVGNQSLDSRDPQHPPELANSERIYQQQLSQQPIQNQSPVENRPMEIPAAKVRSSLAELELQASNAIQRLEAIKINSNPEIPPVFNANATSTNGQLAKDRYAPTDILSILENVIVSSATEPEENDDPDLAEPEYLLPALNEISHLALITHSIMAYLTQMDHRKFNRVIGKINNETNRWLSHLFRFNDAKASYHGDNADTMLRAVRFAIVNRCPGYLEDVYLGKPPVAKPCLYICENSSQIALQYACRQLGLTANSIRLVPTNTSFDNFGTMDISALQELITNDISMKRTPLFVVGDAGASICGEVDNIQCLQEICRTHSIWLHLRGHTLAALSTIQGSMQTDGQSQPISDSMTLNFGGWLGLPNLPVVLLHRHVEHTAAWVDSDLLHSRRVTSLSLWTSLQAYGRDQLSGRIQIAFDCCRMVYEIVKKCQGIRVLSKAPGTNCRITDLIYKPLNISLLFESAVPVVVFQFDGSSCDIIPQRQTDPSENAEPKVLSNTSQNVSSDSVEATTASPNDSSSAPTVDATQQLMINKSIEKVSNFAYFDKLNGWLGQNLQRDCPDVSLEMREHQIHGTCIRFCPFELGLGDSIPSIEQLELLEDCLSNQIDILRATCKHKATLNRLVEQSTLLRLVPLLDWAGLGGVRYVPDAYETFLDKNQANFELNKLNADLVERLRATDNAFSLGEGADGLTCVRFGMVTEDTDVEELLDLVISIGRSVQENSRVLDSMSEIVKKGIETASADLQRESDEKLLSDGILRHVPIVGSVVNWFSPPAKETGIRGRSLNLEQGVVESTENIYKYHMQLTNDGKNQIQGTTKIAPQPIVQTSVSSGHSRQSSATSTTTHYDQPAIAPNEQHSNRQTNIQ